MEIVDTHCHLDFDAFDSDRAAVVERAADAGVQALVLIGIHPEAWDATERLSQTQPGIVRALGFHPNSVADTWRAGAIDQLREGLRGDDIVALGEIGLDYYRGAESRDVQREAFHAQLELARELDLPVVIHQRSAEDEVLDMLAAFAPCRGVMHCFGGDVAFARRCVDLGMHLGIGGIATFKRADEVRDAIRSVPLDCLVVETDAPFLAPQGHRGKRNEPAYLMEVVATIADVRGSTSDEIAEATTSNATDLFGSWLENAVNTGLRAPA